MLLVGAATSGEAAVERPLPPVPAQEREPPRKRRNPSDLAGIHTAEAVDISYVYPHLWVVMSVLQKKIKLFSQYQFTHNAHLTEQGSKSGSYRDSIK